MPLEGHWRRTNTPLRRLSSRERNVALGGVLVTLLAVVVLILATAGDTQPPPAAGCIRVQVAGRVGGELIHACGKEAEAICARATRFDDPRGRKVVESCRERGIRF